MKKFRGQKRYYSKLSDQIDEYNLDTSEGSWYDFWHVHTDWNGYGNMGWFHRKKHVGVLLQIFKKFLVQAEYFNQPYQIWVSVDLKDSSYDAIFVHTQNPNEDNFPFKLNEVDWSIDPPKHYSELLTGEFRFGMLRGVYGPAYVIQSKQHGLPL